MRVSLLQKYSIKHLKDGRVTNIYVPACALSDLPLRQPASFGPWTLIFLSFLSHCWKEVWAFYSADQILCVWNTILFHFSSFSFPPPKSKVGKKRFSFLTTLFSILILLRV